MARRASRPKAESHMNTIPSLLGGLLLTLPSTLLSQYTPPDPSGFEGVVVETYYVADGDDAADTDGGTGLTAGAVTYRVFVDLRPGYKLLTVAGFTDHALTIGTTTSFFNNDDRGENWGGDIDDAHLDENTVAIDTWLAMGGASDAHWGVLKAADPDGSIVGGANNDGGSNAVPGGLLANDVPLMGVPLTTSDGLLPGVPPAVNYVGTMPGFLLGAGSTFSSDDFAWAVLGGVEHPDTANRVLVGQFTTDGTFSFCLNLWVKIPDSLVCSDPNCHEILEFYGNLLESDTAGTGFNTDNKFTHPSLCFTSTAPVVDCEGVPGGTALPGTACDDGNADTDNDVYDAGCLCVGEDCLGVLGGNALPGQPCDDGDPNTVDDTWQTGCACVGTVGVAELPSASTIGVHPNPTDGRLIVEIGDGQGALVRYAVNNALGERVLAGDLGTVMGDRTVVLDLSWQPSGVYFVTVLSGAQEHVFRVARY